MIRLTSHFTGSVSSPDLFGYCTVQKIMPLPKIINDVIKWKHFPRYWSLVPGIHRSPVNSPHKGQWRGALVFSLICAWINPWVNNREAGDLRCHCAHYDIIVMTMNWKLTLDIRFHRVHCLHYYQQLIKTPRQPEHIIWHHDNTVISLPPSYS